MGESEINREEMLKAVLKIMNPEHYLLGNWKKFIEPKDSDPEYVKFLKNLDNKLHYKTVESMTTNISGTTTYSLSDNYTSEKISKEEMEKLVQTLNEGINQNKLIFYPTRYTFTFPGIVYSVRLIEGYYPLAQISEHEVLKFKEQQLPDGYNFETLSEIFLSKENMEMLKLFEKDLEDKHRLTFSLEHINDKKFYEEY